MDAKSSAVEKIALFRALFAGRDDAYATRWSNTRTGKSGWSPAVVGGPANAKRPDREYLPLTDAVIEAHLSGRIHVGLYTPLPDDSCRLLACDFDGSSWPLDARAYQDAAQALGTEAATERSRSGHGAHVWILFAGRVPASVARRIGAHLLREAMTIRAELDLASYDRLFPAQDFDPSPAPRRRGRPASQMAAGSSVGCGRGGWGWGTRVRGRRNMAFPRRVEGIIGRRPAPVDRAAVPAGRPARVAGGPRSSIRARGRRGGTPRIRPDDRGAPP